MAGGQSIGFSARAGWYREVDSRNRFVPALILYHQRTFLYVQMDMAVRLILLRLATTKGGLALAQVGYRYAKIKTSAGYIWNNPE